VKVVFSYIYCTVDSPKLEPTNSRQKTLANAFALPSDEFEEGEQAGAQEHAQQPADVGDQVARVVRPIFPLDGFHRVDEGQSQEDLLLASPLVLLVVEVDLVLQLELGPPAGRQAAGGVH